MNENRPIMLRLPMRLIIITSIKQNNIRGYFHTMTSTAISPKNASKSINPKL